MNFGNVNGLGFGPGAGLTTVAAAGGVVYSTPYLLQPVFTDFTSTTATIKTFVSTTLPIPTILILRDAAASAGPYNNIGTTAGTATQITNTAGEPQLDHAVSGPVCLQCQRSDVFQGKRFRHPDFYDDGAIT